MSTIGGNEELSGTETQRSAKLKALVHRWREALAEIRESLLSGDRRQLREHNRRDGGVTKSASAGDLNHVSEDGAEPIRPEPLTGDGDTGGRELVPLPTDRSQALAHLCDLLLQELDGADLRSAEIRFVVHKQEDPGSPRLDPDSLAGAGNAELIWKVRQLIAWSGGTIADVARALETRVADLDENARELLRDDVAAIDVDLEALNVLLAESVDWDSEFEWLLAGEVAPFDDPAGREDDEDDERDD